MTLLRESPLLILLLASCGRPVEPVAPALKLTLAIDSTPFRYGEPIRWRLELESQSGLQRADSVALDRMLADVQWDSADAASRSRPRCGTVGSAVATSATRSTSRADGLLPIFFVQPLIRDSESVGLVAVSLVIPGTGAVGRTLRLVYRDAEELWVRARGRLDAVCRNATEERR
jgi:hypothetical protein